jgi:hypothetical protein
MQMRPEIQIQSILKAMSDVVLPAVDPKNPLAQEQARLCMGMLSVMAAQLPRQFKFDCDELARLLDLSKTLQGLSSAKELAPTALQSLHQSDSIGKEVQLRAKADPSEVLDAVRALRASTSRVIQEAFSNDATGSKTGELQRTILNVSKEQILRDRAWVIGQGWESDPKAVPPIDELISSANKAS